MGLYKTTRRLVNNKGTLKCKTTKAILQSKRRDNFTTNGCKNLKQLRNINYTSPPARYRKASKILLPEIYERLGLVFPYNNKIIGKYKETHGIVVMYKGIYYIIVGNEKLYIKLPREISGKVKSYILSGQERQGDIMARATGERNALGEAFKAAGRAGASVINP